MMFVSENRGRADVGRSVVSHRRYSGFMQAKSSRTDEYDLKPLFTGRGRVALNPEVRRDNFADRHRYEESGVSYSVRKHTLRYEADQQDIAQLSNCKAARV